MRRVARYSASSFLRGAETPDRFVGSPRPPVLEIPNDCLCAKRHASGYLESARRRVKHSTAKWTANGILSFPLARQRTLSRSMLCKRHKQSNAGTAV
jgi:hypothetical protein